MSCMEYDKQGDVEEDHADDVHADDVAMEVVEHGQNGVHQERDDEGSQADLDTYTFGAVHILRNTNLGSRETPPPPCNIVINREAPPLCSIVINFNDPPYVITQ